MRKPFQFPMWRLFFATFFFCVACWMTAIQFSRHDLLVVIQISVFLGSVGAAIGMIFGRAMAGATWGLAVCLAYICWLLWFAPFPLHWW